MKKFITGLFCEPDGSPSSKRFVGILGALSLIVTLLLGTVLAIRPNSDIIDAVTIVTLGSLGITGAEKIFSAIHGKKSESIEHTESTTINTNI